MSVAAVRRSSGNKRKADEPPALLELVQVVRHWNGAPADAAPQRQLLARLLDDVVRDMTVPVDARRRAIRDALTEALALDLADVVGVFVNYRFLLVPPPSASAVPPPLVPEVELRVPEIVRVMQDDNLTMVAVMLKAPVTETGAVVVLPDWPFRSLFGLWNSEDVVQAIRSVEMVHVIFDTLGGAARFGRPEALSLILEAALLRADAVSPPMPVAVVARILELAYAPWEAHYAEQTKHLPVEQKVEVHTAEVSSNRLVSNWSQLFNGSAVRTPQWLNVYMTLLQSPFVQGFFMDSKAAAEDFDAMLGNHGSAFIAARRVAAPYLVHTYLQDDWDFKLRFPAVVRNLEHHFRRIANLLHDALTVAFVAEQFGAQRPAARTLLDFAELLGSQPFLPSRQRVEQLPYDAGVPLWGSVQFYGVPVAKVLEEIGALYRRVAFLLRDSLNSVHTGGSGVAIVAGASRGPASAVGDLVIQSPPLRARLSQAVSRLLERVADAEPERLRLQGSRAFPVAALAAPLAAAAVLQPGARADAVALALEDRPLPADVAELITLMEYSRPLHGQSGTSSRRRRLSSHNRQ